MARGAEATQMTRDSRRGWEWIVLALAMTVATLCFAPAAYAVLATGSGLIALWGALFVFMFARLIGLGLRYRGDAWLVTGAMTT